MSDDDKQVSGAAEQLATDQASAGQLVAARYRLDERIGAGGMGSVWRARDLRLDRDVAVKLVSLAEKLARMRFVREGKVAARLDHPGLCRVYDVGEHSGTGYLVMELLAGETVYHRMQRQNPGLTWRMQVMAEVARAMAAAHAQGLVHRDLKPDNLFLDTLTGRERTVVIDFGLAFLDGEHGELGRLTSANITGGTPPYMAPEQARALAIGPPVDVYALGCVLYELVAGRPPFEGQASAVMSNQVFAQPATLTDLVPGLDPRVSDLVDAMMAKAPEARPTMLEVAERLDQLVTTRKVGGRPSSPGVKVQRPPAKNLDAVGAMPIIPAIGGIAVMGPITDDILVAAACSGLTARRTATVADVVALVRTQPRIVILAEADAETTSALCKIGPPVIGVAPASDLDLASRLTRLGCADVLTRPIQAAVATRKILRALRRLPGKPSAAM